MFVFSLFTDQIWYVGPKGNQSPRKVIYTVEEIETVLTDLHGKGHEGTGGHLRQNKTYSLVNDRYFWFGMVKDVETWVRATIRENKI